MSERKVAGQMLFAFVLLAAAPTLYAQGQSHGQGQGTPPHEQILNAVSNLQSSMTGIQAALTQLAGGFGVKPKSIVLFHDLSANSLSSGSCADIALADAGMTMIGSLRIVLPAAGPGTSLTVDSSPTASPPFLLLSRQANFNTPQVIEGLSFTGRHLRVCNGSFATANSGLIEIQGTAIQFNLKP